MARAIRDRCWKAARRAPAGDARRISPARLDHGLTLLYRRGERGRGRRTLIGAKKYRVVKIGTADDRQNADGVAVFNFSQAQKAARALFEQSARSAAGLPDKTHGPGTVGDAMRDYLAHLGNDGRNPKNVTDARRKVEAHIIPKLGGVRLDKLTAPQVQAWHHGLAKQPPRLRVRNGGKQRHRVVDMADAETRRSRQATANRLLGILKAALNMAWRHDRVHDDRMARSPVLSATASRARIHVRRVRVVERVRPDFRALVQARCTPVAAIAS